MEKQAAKIHDHILKRAQHILLVSHPSPDGDTLSAACAFAQYLKRLEKKHTPFCTTSISVDLLFLPDAHRFTNDKNIFARHTFDTMCFFDTGDLQYAGVQEILRSLPYAPTIINFDHHHTNTLFGQHNFVITDAASTTEVLYHYFRALDVPLSADMATALLTGLVTDTGNFTNQATTTQSLAIGAELLRKGARFDLILQKTFRNKTVRALHVWGLMLSRLTYKPEYDLTFTFIRQQDLRDAQVTEEESDGLANFLNVLGEGRAVLVLRETPDGHVKGSMRTTREDVDVSAWAKRLGGGGHIKAAGFTIKNASIPDAEAAWQLFLPALADEPPLAA